MRIIDADELIKAMQSNSMLGDYSSTDERITSIVDIINNAVEQKNELQAECIYCKFEETYDFDRTGANIIDTGTFFMWIKSEYAGSTLKVMDSNQQGYATVIKYCPMCGRLL